MPNFLEVVLIDVARAITQLITGKLLTEGQIKSISRNIVGAHFADWLPTPKEQVEAERRVDVAREHITKANRIILDLQNDLEGQAKQLDAISREMEEKKKLADRYRVLAETNEEIFAAYKAEMEDTIRKELVAQAERGKRLRQLVTLIGWVLTLIIGAFLGAYLEIRLENNMKGNPPIQPPEQIQPQK